MTGADRGTIIPPPVTRAMSKGGGGGACECPNAQEWGCFSKSKGGGALVNVLKAKGDDGTRAMSKGCVCVLVNVFTPPPPLGNPVSAPDMDA